MRTHQQQELEPRALRLFRERYGEVPPGDRAEFLRLVGVGAAASQRKPVSLELTEFDPQAHANPIMLSYWLKGQISDAYVTEWRAHVRTCDYCTNMYEFYGVPLEK